LVELRLKIEAARVMGHDSTGFELRAASARAAVHEIYPQLDALRKTREATS
jgi:hypothetical protein